MALVPAWVLCALAVSFLGAAQVQANQIFQMQGMALVFVRSVFACILLAPVAAWLPWPHVPQFYVFALGVSLLNLVGDVTVFKAAGRFGGRLTSVFLPLKIVGAFVVWLAIDPAYTHALLAEPFKLAGVVACLLGCCAGLLFMRRNDASWAALLFLLPAGAAYTLADVGSKITMQGHDLLAAAAAMTCLSMGLHCMLSFLALKTTGHSPKALLADRAHRKAGLFLGIMTTGLIAFLFAGFATAENPAYVTAVSLLTVAWLTLYNRLRGHDDHASPLAIGVLVAAAVGLVLVTA